MNRREFVTRASAAAAASAIGAAAGQALAGAGELIKPSDPLRELIRPIQMPPLPSPAVHIWRRDGQGMMWGLQFRTMGEATAAARPGDVIEIGAGEYFEACEACDE